MGTFHKVAEAKGLAPGKGMAIELREIGLPFSM